MIALGVLLGLLAATVPATWAARATLSSLLASSAVRGGGGHGRMRRAHGRRAGCALARAPQQRRARRAQRRAPAARRSRLQSRRRAHVPRPESAGVLSEAGRPRRVPGSRRARARGDSRRHRRERDVGAAADRRRRSRCSITFPGAPGNTGVQEHDCAARRHDRHARDSTCQVMGMRIVAGRAFDPVAPRRPAGGADRSAGSPSGSSRPAIRSARRFRARHPPLHELRAEACRRLHDRRRGRAGATVRRPPGRAPAALHPHRGLGVPAAVVRRAHRP